MIRGQIGFETNGGITGRLIADYSQSDASCCGAIEVLRSPVETAGLFGAVSLGARGGMTGQPVAIDGNDNDAAEAALSNLTGTANQLPENSSDQFGFVAEIDIPLSDNIDATYIGSYREFDSLAQYDSAFSGLALFNVLPVSPTNLDTMTHELRFQGDAMGRSS